MRHLLAVCCFALAAALPGAETVKIVSSLPLTGSANTQCASMVNGIRMAVEEAGGKVTIAGTSYDLVYESWDDASAQAGGKWDPQVEGANARKAIADPDVLAYIGTYNSGAAKVSMPTLNAAGLAMLSPANTWPGLTKPGVGESNEPAVYRPSGRITYFRVVPADDLQGAVGAAWAQEMGAKRVFILHDRELYGQGIARMFKLNAEKLGLTVVGMEGIDGRASNYKSLVTKIRAAQVDLVYFGGTTETGAGQLAKDLAGGGVKARLMGPDAFFNSALMSAAGDAALEERVFVTFGGVPPEQQTGKGKAFVDAYQAKYGQMPEGYAIYAYECAKVALDAMTRAKAKDRAAVVEAIAATRDYDGALGRWSFDANGDTTMTVMSGNTVRGGQFQFVKLLGQ